MDYELSKTGECLNIHFGRSGIAFCKKTDRKYDMRIFVHTTPKGSNGWNFGHNDWTFEHRKDFFRRKGDVEKVMLDYVERYKLYIIETIFGVND